MTPAATVPALLAGFCFAVSWALQHRAARAEARHEVFDPRLLVRLVRRPQWLAGRAAAVAGVVLQAFALRHGALSVVGPIMIIGPVCAVPLTARLDRRPLAPGTVPAVLATATGLACFLTAVAPEPGRRDPSAAAWAGVVVAGSVTVVACLLATPAAQPATAAALLGTATGVLFGLAAALLKAAGGGSLGAFLTGGQLYAWLGVSAFALILNQNAFQQGSFAVALTALVIAEPLTALIVGWSAFGEHPSVDGTRLTFATVGAVAMAVGVVRLAQRARPDEPHRMNLRRV